MTYTNSRYLLAIASIASVGPVLARQLISYFGSAENLFSESIKNIRKLPRVGHIIAEEITKGTALKMADAEIEYVIKNNIKICTYLDNNYPNRLKNCDDGPILFFHKGNIDFNSQKMISIVGARNATEYGKSICENLITDLAHHNPIIVSGLAYGIDICAHKAALKMGIPTIAVMGTSMQKVNPTPHYKYALEIQNHGAIISEYHTQTKFEKSLFVRRNRLIAGLSDATIIVESKLKGGSLITADFANQYNRDVFAFPGPALATYSEGCNQLIKNNKAALIENAADVETFLNWDVNKTKVGIQKQLFIELQDDEQVIFDILKKENKEITADQIAILCNFAMSKTSSLLLTLEFKGIIKTLPGKRYKIA